jgi:hypothetical protein
MTWPGERIIRTTRAGLIPRRFISNRAWSLIRIGLPAISR